MNTNNLKFKKILKKFDCKSIDTNKFITGGLSIADVMAQSASEWAQFSENTLTHEEISKVYEYAENERKKNLFIDSYVISRKNPLLSDSIKSGIKQNLLQRNYDKMFGARTNEYVQPGAISSMFSPAAYLTEMFRETHDLHPSNSLYSLENRRNDLSDLILSQQNMDEEISTLSLSNELLLNIIHKEHNINQTEFFSKLSTYRETGSTPFDYPFEIIRQSIILQDEKFNAILSHPDIISQIDLNTLIAIESNISPELYNILLEDLQDENISKHLTENFGDIDINAFKNIVFLTRYYGLSESEIADILGEFFLNNNFTSEAQYYHNDQLFSVTENNNMLNSRVLTRTYGVNGSQFGYAELLPVSDNNYLFRFTTRVGPASSSLPVSIGTTGPQSSNIINNQHILHAHGRQVSVPVTLTDTALDDGVTIGVTRFTGQGGFHYATVSFRQNRSYFPNLLLKLNKLIRLYQATGISPRNIRTVLDSTGQNMHITDSTLKQLFWVNQYMQYYGVKQSEAIVLSNASISLVSYNGEASDFDLLFNTPQLNNHFFVADNSAVNLDPSVITDTFRTSVLKRAFNVNDTELYTLWCLTHGTTTPPIFTCSIGNISALYRISLMAKVHHLSISQLAMLISVSPFSGIPIGILSQEQLIEINIMLYLCLQWLNARRLGFNELYIMTTGRHDTNMTPEINNLITSLQNGLANQSNFLDDETYIQAAAPLLAASAQFDSNEIAIAVLKWINEIKPAGLNVIQFLNKVGAYIPEDNNAALVIFCHRLAQLTLITRSLRLSAEEINYAISHPGDFQPGAKILSNTLIAVLNLGRFQSWLKQCGKSAMDILAALQNGTLTPLQLARAMGEDEQMMVQGLAQNHLAETFFTGWSDVNITLQWISISRLLGITPSGISALISLQYRQGNMQPYSEWNQISNIIQAGLDNRKAEELRSSLEVSISDVLSDYVIKNLTPSHVINRDELYSWLLLDNQVSAEVKTTRLAEAIASLQLFINRGLNGQEQGISNTVRARRFLADWDIYNRRYSTWAGVSRLVYYPENYINPIMRIGQTGMMDEMLQTISQSQLTNDAVENAFNTYMTHFEEVADLKILSGYHDSLSSQNGNMYVIGHQSITDKYYWRKLEHDKEQYGKFPANAWSEWNETTTAAQPFNNQIHPVIFNSRLYLFWLEQRTITYADGQNSQVSYELRYSFIRHDGTWSIVSIVSLNNIFTEDEIKSISNLHLYCTRDSLNGQLLVVLYSPQLTSEGNRTTPILSMFINSQHSVNRTDSILRDQLWPYFDTTISKKVSQLYAPKFTTSSISLSSGWGAEDITMLHGGKVNNVRLTYSMEDVRLLIDVDVRIIYNGLAGTPVRTQVNLMKQFGTMGDSFHIYRRIGRNPNFNTTGRLFIPAYRMSSSNRPGQLLINRTVVSGSEPRIEAWLPSRGISLISTSQELNLAIPQTQITDNQFINNYIFINDNTLSATDVSDGYTIQTGISPQNVVVTARIGSITNTFTAQTHISASQLPELNFNETIYSFRDLALTVPLSDFVNNRANISFDLTANATDGRFLGRQTGTLTVYSANAEQHMDILQGDQGEQYLQKGAFRTRLNTLIARSLVERSNRGLNAVLSMETQMLEEPQLGEGSYVDVRFHRYSQALHGDGWYRLYIIGATDTGTTNRSRDLVATGQVSDTEETTLRLFLPRNPKTHETNRIYIGVVYSDVNLSESFTTMQDFTFNPAQRMFIPANNNASNRTRGLRSFVLNRRSEPMDFSGSNALYFWEMFYYVPMMVFRRLLDEHRFTEATQWIKFIWSPEGYFIDGQHASFQWNVRPLEEDTSWNSNPLDTVDPDAIAQADPMHYKLSVFMGWIDLLLARGDSAYRQLERDTLNEAKMWYVQALSLMGERPSLSLSDSINWSNPNLGEAADRVRQLQKQKSLLELREDKIVIEPLTANSLLDLFRPQINEKLVNYWQTLEQRLFNLRNNLTIDGQPLFLPFFSSPASPHNLQSAAVTSFRGGSDLPASIMSVYRFPVMLRSARELTRQLSFFGLTLLSLIERQDNSALSVLLHTHGMELMHQGIDLQNKVIEEIDADRQALVANLQGAQNRFNHYSQLWNENISTNENAAMGLSITGSLLTTTAILPYTVAGVLDTAPNIYGMAFGGMELGAVAKTVGGSIELLASSMHSLSDAISQSEAYRRRHQEWEIQREDADAEIKEFEAHLDVLKIRHEAALMQKVHLEKEYALLREQEEFIDGQFSGVALYSWLRGRLSAIYRQFYDLTVSRCLMVEEAYRWSTGNSTARFIRPGAWQGTQAGLMAADALNLNLTQMEHAYLSLNEREKEVTRTISLAEVFQNLPGNDGFVLSERIRNIVGNKQGSAGSLIMGLQMNSGQLRVMVRLSELNIMQDYPTSIGTRRRIRNISVTLPSLEEYHHDIRAILNYGGSVILPQGCNAQVVSHGRDDSGQFNLNFNDERWLPFEGIPINDTGTFTLSFPDAVNRQSELLENLSDIILCIRYTIMN